MTEAEKQARKRIAELYRETPPDAARRKINEIGTLISGPHGPLGFYICGMPCNPC